MMNLAGLCSIKSRFGTAGPESNSRSFKRSVSSSRAEWYLRLRLSWHGWHYASWMLKMFEHVIRWVCRMRQRLFWSKNTMSRKKQAPAWWGQVETATSTKQLLQQSCDNFFQSLIYAFLCEDWAPPSNTQTMQVDSAWVAHHVKPKQFRVGPALERWSGDLNCLELRHAPDNCPISIIYVHCPWYCAVNCRFRKPLTVEDNGNHYHIYIYTLIYIYICIYIYIHICIYIYIIIVIIVIMMTVKIVVTTSDNKWQQWS